METTKPLYGYCPVCGAPGVSRERRPNGYDCCAAGHTYNSCDTLTLAQTAAAVKEGTLTIGNMPQHPMGPDPVTWRECLRISDLPGVAEALKNFAADQTEDNATCLVRAVLEAAPKT